MSLIFTFYFSYFTLLDIIQGGIDEVNLILGEAVASGFNRFWMRCDLCKRCNCNLANKTAA